MENTATNTNPVSAPENLLERQFDFASDIALLLAFAIKSGYNISLKECLRPIEMEKIYKEEGKSWLTNPNQDYHLNSLAFDLCFFHGEVWIQDYATIKPLGDYFMSLRKGNVWGGSWSVRDCMHFQGR
jgi:hypothetical protein